MESKELRHLYSGQSIAEYVILIAIVSAVLVGMQVYMKRGIQAVVRVAADQVGSQEDANETAKDGVWIDESSQTGSSSGVTRKRSFVDGSYRTDVNQASQGDVPHDQSHSDRDKTY